ncbi:MAG: RagB/SusD family nutrient uptake outer membrane protein [Cytophagales bacterium]|nr:RagB/SusD family nutrient uptake outer membrane protein [Cytophagales bacterium]
MRFDLKYGFLTVVALLAVSGCREVLEPQPNNVLTADIVLTTPEDVPAVRVGLYGAVRGTAPLTVVAGDLTADMATHNGTFTVYNELGNKRITSSNGAASAFWGSLYQVIYISNFIQERLPRLTSVPQAQRNELLAEASLMEGYAYFLAAYTYGDVPFVTTTDVDANRNLPRVPRAQVLDSALRYMQRAIPNLPDSASAITAFASKDVANAMLARFYLYNRNWQEAENHANRLINAGRFRLESSFERVITREFDSETIFEMGFGNTSNDDPGTSTFGLNNIFIGRREVIPSNEFLLLILSQESGERRLTVDFDFSRQRGSDNGFSVNKYSGPDQGFNNITLFRLPEMYLIRAEARARQGNLTGAAADVNVLRRRARAPELSVGNQADMLTAIERERVYELAFEGHRWYDLVRTGRAGAVMSAFSSNWREAYERWPVPQTEIQRNPALRGQQNPGY